MVFIQIIESQVSNNGILGCSLKRCFDRFILACFVVTYTSFQHNIYVLSRYIYIYIFSYPHSLFRSMMTNVVTKARERKLMVCIYPFDCPNDSKNNACRIQFMKLHQRSYRVSRTSFMTQYRCFSLIDLQLIVLQIDIPT